MGHSYLFIDLTQGINEALRFRTNIFNKTFSTCYCDLKQFKQNDGISSKSIKGQQAYVVRIKNSEAQVADGYYKKCRPRSNKNFM